MYVSNINLYTNPQVLIQKSQEAQTLKTDAFNQISNLTQTQSNTITSQNSNKSSDSLFNKIDQMKRHLLLDRDLEHAFQGGKITEFNNLTKTSYGYSTNMTQFNAVEAFSNGYKLDDQDKKLANEVYQERLASTPVNEYGCQFNTNPRRDASESLKNAQELKKEIMAELNQLNKSDQAELLEGMQEIFKWINIMAQAQGQMSKYIYESSQALGRADIDWGNPEYGNSLKEDSPKIKSEYMDFIKTSLKAREEEIELIDKMHRTQEQEIRMKSEDKATRNNSQ